MTGIGDMGAGVSGSGSRNGWGPPALLTTGTIVMTPTAGIIKGIINIRHTRAGSGLQSLVHASSSYQVVHIGDFIMIIRMRILVSIDAAGRQAGRPEPGHQTRLKRCSRKAAIHLA